VNIDLPQMKKIRSSASMDSANMQNGISESMNDILRIRSEDINSLTAILRAFIVPVCSLRKAEPLNMNITISRLQRLGS